MTTASESGAWESGPRTYGNWRRARGFGIGSLSPGQTYTLAGAVGVPLVALNVSVQAGLALIPISVLVAAAMLVRIGGQSLVDVVTRRVRFTRARSAGWTELSGGLLTDHPRGQDLPGPMATVVPLDTDDGRGGRQGLLWDRRTGRLTVVFPVSPVGLDLANRDQADAWVASWGGLLADLGYQPMVRHVAVTVDTAPSGGTTLRDYLNRRIDPTAPAAARQVIYELAAATPATSADVDTRVAITFDPARANPRPADLVAAVAEVTRWLPGLEAGLAACGVAVLGRATVDGLIGRLRVAYDPASRGDVARALATPHPSPGYPSAGRGGRSDRELLAWAEAGPLRASEAWDRWWHDSGVSVSWALAEAPRQAVLSRVLAPLVAPGPFPRRVTLLYQPYPAEDAATEVEREITNNSVRTAFARRTRRDETQRDRDDAARALQAAREEAEGAGVGRFTFYLSTTISSDVASSDVAGVDGLLGAAAADVEQRAGQSKLRLRRLRGAQAAGFAAALGFGLDPVELGRRGRR
jgi:hypothetical protein